MSNYIQQVKDELANQLAEFDSSVEDELLDLYALLVLVRGEKCTLEDVHDAWSVWKNQTHATHRSLIPFGELSRQVQAMDNEYAVAIRKTAKELQL